MKKVFWVVAIAALVVAIVLIALKAYYVVVAFLVGILLMGCREIWSLLRWRKMPPIDERVQENTGKAVRNGFIFYVTSTAFLMLPFSVKLVEGPTTIQVLGGLFIAAAVVYLVSYFYYDRVRPGLSEKDFKVLRTFILISGISLVVGIVSVFLHNAIYALFIQIFGADFWERVGIPDEPVFFIIATIISPLGIVVGIIGSMVIYFKALFCKVAGGQR